MNRVIKFRLWDVENKEYFTEGFSVSMDGLFWYDDNGFGCRITPETYILEQFTGLHDKNGVEVYADDIMLGQTEFRIYHVDGGFVIKSANWDHITDDLISGDELITEPLSHPQVRQFIESCEVIGNIHQTTTPSI